MAKQQNTIPPKLPKYVRGAEATILLHSRSTTMADRRTKRMRTRQAQRAWAVDNG